MLVDRQNISQCQEKIIAQLERAPSKTYKSVFKICLRDFDDREILWYWRICAGENTCAALWRWVVSPNIIINCVWLVHHTKYSTCWLIHTFSFQQPQKGENFCKFIKLSMSRNNQSDRQINWKVTFERARISISV